MFQNKLNFPKVEVQFLILPKKINKINKIIYYILKSCVIEHLLLIPSGYHLLNFDKLNYSPLVCGLCGGLKLNPEF